METRPFSPHDKESVVRYIAEFRVTIALLKNKTIALDLKSAQHELEEFLENDHPVFVAEVRGNITGYVICRVDDSVVWAEHLYIAPDFRRRGIASALYSEVEKLAEDLGGDTAFNWVHPNNDTIIAFLKKLGYSVLNLIEVRKPWKNESRFQKITVGKHDFDY